MFAKGSNAPIITRVAHVVTRSRSFRRPLQTLAVLAGLRGVGGRRTVVAPRRLYLATAGAPVDVATRAGAVAEGRGNAPRRGRPKLRVVEMPRARLAPFRGGASPSLSVSPRRVVSVEAPRIIRFAMNDIGN